MSERMERAREEICRVGASLFARGYVHASAGNISARVGDEYLVTPTDAPMGFLEADRISHVDADGNQLSGDRASKALVLHRRIYASDPEAAFVIHTHSTHLVALTLCRRVVRRRHPSAHHPLLRDESRSRTAHPVPPTGRPGRGRPGRGTDRPTG